MDTSVFLTGLMMGFGFIVAIGAQNAFVLRHGLRGTHVFWICATCAMSDAILIAFGVTGFGAITARVPWIDPVMRYGGAAFLTWYGIKSMRAAFTSEQALDVDGQLARAGLWPTIGTCLALTWLNPHVYLDTVVLLGAISTQFDGQKTAFASGAIAASVLFFFGLGYGAAYLRGLFVRPVAWRILEGVIAVVVWSIAFRLVVGG